MKSSNILTQKVNFYIAATFIAVFGFFTVSITLRTLALADPVTSAIASTMSMNSTVR